MNKQMLDGIVEERNKAWEQAKAIIDGAESEKREMTGEEETSYAKITAELDVLDKRMNTLIEASERDARAEEARSKAEKLIRPEKDADKGGDETSEFEKDLRAFLAGERREVNVRPDKPLTVAEMRTLSKLTAGAGGNTVRTAFYAQLQQHMIEVSGVLSAGPTVLNTDNGESIQIPKTTAHSAAALTAEAATIAASDPAFGQASLGAYKYAVLIQMSNELVSDTSIDLLGYLSMEVGRALGNQFGVHLVTGTGSSQPGGVATGATTGATGAASVGGAFNADNIIDLYYSVIEPYRNSPSCGWLLRDATLAGVRKLKDSTGQYLWQPSLQVGVPDTLLGKAVHTDPNVAAVGLAAKSILFGDFSRYFVRQVNGIRFERSDDFAFSSDLVTFRGVLRGDGTLVDTTGAIKAFVGNAA